MDPNDVDQTYPISPATGRSREDQIDDDLSEEEGKEQEFVEMVINKTKQIVDDGLLDDVGFEDEESQIDHLDMWMDQQRNK